MIHDALLGSLLIALCGQVMAGVSRPQFKAFGIVLHI